MAGRIHRSSQDSHQPHPIAQVQLDASGDAAAQVGPSGLSGSAGWSGADQGFSGHLDQILPLHQREQAPGGSGSQGISQEQVLQHQSITGLRAERLRSWPAGFWRREDGSEGSHRGDGGGAPPHRPAAAPAVARTPPLGACPDP